MTVEWDAERLMKLLELDLEHMQRAVENFDRLRFTIRGWAITTVGALIALGVSGKNAAMPLIGLFVVVFFAYLEILYMDMQVRVMTRSADVAHLITMTATNPPQLPGPDYRYGMRTALGNEPFRWRRVPRILASRPELYMFHIGLLTVVAAAAISIFAIYG